MSITGITLIRNGNELHYPWKLSIQSMLTCCDEVIVNCDPDWDTDDDTYGDLYEMSKYDPIKIIESRWDMSNTGDGSMLANEANRLLPFVKTDWVLYLQADELIHEKDAAFIAGCINHNPPRLTSIEFLRTYFWGSLTTRYKPHEIYLARLFKRGAYVVGGDGMHLVKLNPDDYACKIDPLIYHYSRMGTEEQITKRIRNLDKLFHEENVVNTFKPFNYKEADNRNLMFHYNDHPAGIKEFYE